MSGKVYEIVTKKIIEQLENGVVPWRQPWTNFGRSVNWVTQKAYRGINVWLLPPGEYASKKQILKAGGRIKYEEMKKSKIVVYWLWKEIEDKETEEKKKIATPFYYQVWEINTQVEGLQSKRKNETFEHSPIEEAEKIFKGFINSPTYSFKPEGAYYQPGRDHINVPPLKAYKNPDEYYCTLFHEMVHSTGHKDRLNRTGITALASFGSEVYSKEELVAELGASFLCGISRIDSSTIENSASYIQSWLNALKNDKRLVVQAASQAQKAADYILGVKYEEGGDA
ncbi:MULTISPECIES: ArdC family protein [Bacillota]|uniref:ArdC family protein n=1 Tax=Bacillota TaxID=1239 RepID=UPI0039F097F5